MKRAFENGEISEAQYLTYAETHAPEAQFEVVGGTTKEPVIQQINAATPVGPGSIPSPYGGSSPYPENANPFEQVDLIDVGADLTEDDKIYLAMKWGRLYSAADWVWLEQKYNDFVDSFDIQNASRDDTLQFICKTSLKMNQALDSGDIDSYQKLARVYDAQMKAAKFTEAQKKEDKAAEFGCYGQIVAFCEAVEGFIPRLETKTDRDIADKDLHDMKNWTQELIEQDPAVFKQIEQYIKKREIAEEQEKDQAEAIANGDEQYILTDQDLADYEASLDEKEEEEDE